jgi:mono/diheme cytochrome c family protein
MRTLSLVCSAAPRTVLVALLLVLAAAPGWAFAQQATAAAQPATAAGTGANLANPVKATAESQAHAKKVYGYDCALCHGANGNGKGDLVNDLKLTLKDYTDPAALKDLSDGELFTIIKHGKGQMPPEGDRGKTDDMWNLVILVRSFAKKSPDTASAPSAVRP